MKDNIDTSNEDIDIIPSVLKDENGNIVKTTVINVRNSPLLDHLFGDTPLVRNDFSLEDAEYRD